MQANLNSNIWKYALILIANKRIFTAIIGAYYLTIPGVTPFWIGLFMLVGNGASLIFDIPLSYIADKVGHKEAIILSRGILILSTLCFLFADSIEWLIAGSFLLSTGFAFLGGVGNAFMHETLRGLGREADYRTVMGKVSSVGFFVPAILAACVPFSVAWGGYAAPLLVGLFLDAVGFVVAFSLVRPTAHERATGTDDVRYVDVIRQGFALRYFRVAIFGGVIGAILFSIDSFRAPYQIFLGVPVVWFGMFFGAGRMLAALMLAQSGRLHRWIGDLHSFQRLQIVVYGVLLIVLGLATSPWIIVAIFIVDNGLRYGFSQVSAGYRLEIIRDSTYKATLLSSGAQIENVLTMLLVGLLGVLIENFGYQTSFLAYAGAFFAFSIPLYLWIRRIPPVIAAYGTSRTKEA